MEFIQQLKGLNGHPQNQTSLSRELHGCVLKMLFSNRWSTKYGRISKDRAEQNWFQNYINHLIESEGKRINVSDFLFWRLLTKLACNKLLTSNEQGAFENELKLNGFADILQETKIRTKNLLKQEKWKAVVFSKLMKSI